MMNEQAADLGEPQKDFTFKPAAGRFFMVGMLFLFMGMYGLYSVIENSIMGDEEFRSVSAVMAVIYFTSLIVSLFLFRQGFSVRSNVVRLRERGFVVGIGPKEFPFAWDEIDSVTETVVRKWGSGYWHLLVVRSDGESFGFLEYNVDDPAELRDAIQQNTAERGIPWNTQTRS